MLTNRQLEDLNAVVTTQAEQSIVANKIERDNLADAINLYAQFDMTVASQPIAWGGDPASTITNW